jgi:hypothetical protein
MRRRPSSPDWGAPERPTTTIMKLTEIPFGTTDWEAHRSSTKTGATLFIVD